MYVCTSFVRDFVRSCFLYFVVVFVVNNYMECVRASVLFYFVRPLPLSCVIEFCRFVLLY